MLRDITTWTLFFAYGYLMVQGKFTASAEYTFKHMEYFVEVAIVGVFYFLGQLIVYKATKNQQQNVPSYLMSAAMILMVQVSFSFSIHKYHIYQVIGLVMAWGGIGAAFIVWAQRGETNLKVLHKS